MGSTADKRQERRASIDILKMKSQTNSKKSGRRKEECSRGTQKLPGRAMGWGVGERSNSLSRRKRRGLF